MATETLENAPEAYEELLDRYERIAYIGSAAGVLGWDQRVTMPDGGTPARARQQSALSGLRHELLTDEELGELLTACEGADLTSAQQAAVREIRREYDRSARVPQDLVERMSQKSSEAVEIWEEAKAEDDFEQFAPHLEELVELNRQYAEHIDPDRDPYEVLFEGYEPYLPLETAERVLTRLREELPPLIDGIRASDTELARPFEGLEYPVEAQEAFSRAVLDDLGYDWDHGRLDTSSHPFTSGNPYDTRITTRYDESDPLGGLMATIHEFGHAYYGLGIPREEFGSPLGSAMGLTIHESQSRLWENQIGRSGAFWHYLAPLIREHFDGLDDVTPQALYEAASRVYENNMIRVEADELTYHMHIVLRFEIERDLIRGDLDVGEVPAVWNEKMVEYLGIRPETDTEGCLQDIHWSQGSFGYFPTYSLGSVLAAQLDHHARTAIDELDDEVRNGEFGALREWLRQNIHEHGARYTTPELIELATGEEFTADYFLDHVESKYAALYDLDR
ncbi:MAG: carboxypeptidase M32 [Halobacteriaceae archaeon]